MDKDKAYIFHMRDALAVIERYVSGVHFENLATNDMLQDAVIREFEILGEAARNVSETLRGRHPEIPWGEMADMRNKLIHEYFSVDVEIVWKTIQEDLPKLKEGLNAIARTFEDGS